MLTKRCHATLRATLLAFARLCHISAPARYSGIRPAAFIALWLVMTNTLYLPELREMLAENDAAELKEFCIALHPARTAEFMEGLTASEAWAVLEHTDPATRAQ